METISLLAIMALGIVGGVTWASRLILKDELKSVLPSWKEKKMRKKATIYQIACLGSCLLAIALGTLLGNKVNGKAFFPSNLMAAMVITAHCVIIGNIIRNFDEIMQDIKSNKVCNMALLASIILIPIGLTFFFLSKKLSFFNAYAIASILALCFIAITMAVIGLIMAIKFNIKRNSRSS